MTQIEKLDTILIGLVSAKVNSQEIEQPNSGYRFENLCDILNIPLELGEEKILKEILLADENIENTEQITKFLIRISSKRNRFY